MSWICSMKCVPEPRGMSYRCAALPAVQRVSVLKHEQQNAPDIPEGTTIGGAIFASDKTPLTQHSGEVAAHGLYMSLANIHKAVRSRNSRTAWALIAYIPTSKWRRTLQDREELSDKSKTELTGVLNRRLFHRCLSIITRDLRRSEPHPVVDADGHIRMVLYRLLAYIADLEEQLWIAALGSKCCPHCLAKGANLGDEECSHQRTSDSILADLDAVVEKLAILKGGYNLETVLEFLHESRNYGLCGVKVPFWAKLPGIDICKVLCPDLLHGFYKFFFDHVFSWNLTSLKAVELDTRVSSQIQLSGDRVFSNGVSHIHQMSGKEYRDLLRTHVSVVAGAPNGGSSKLTIATRSIVDCIYLAQYPTCSERVLSAFDRSYALFQENKSVWIENGSRKGKNGVIEHFNIPKLHIIRHLADHVRSKGPADNYSTETMERLHIDLVKDAYRASNRREWTLQALRWLTRHEQVRNFDAWLEWSHEDRTGLAGAHTGYEQTHRTS